MPASPPLHLCNVLFIKVVSEKNWSNSPLYIPQLGRDVTRLTGVSRSGLLPFAAFVVRRLNTSPHESADRATQARAEHGRAARRRTPSWTTRTITPRPRHHRGCTLLIRCSLQTRHATAPPPALDPAPSPGESPARPHPPCGPPQLPPRRPRYPPLPAQASTRRTNDAARPEAAYV